MNVELTVKLKMPKNVIFDLNDGLKMTKSQ